MSEEQAVRNAITRGRSFIDQAVAMLRAEFAEGRPETEVLVELAVEMMREDSLAVACAAALMLAELAKVQPSELVQQAVSAPSLRDGDGDLWIPEPLVYRLEGGHSDRCSREEIEADFGPVTEVTP